MQWFRWASMALAAVLIMSAGQAGAAPRDFSTALARLGVCPAVLPAQPESLPGAASFTYKTAGRELRIHVYAPPKQSGPAPAILFFFGGGWHAGQVTAFVDQAKAFAQHGLVAAVADYRVNCRDHTTPADAVLDAQAAYAWLRAHAQQLQVDPARIVLSGGSSGGHLALTAAMLAPVAEKPVALVLFNPAVDLTPFSTVLELDDATLKRISPSRLPVAALPPTVIFHGQADQTVAIETVRAFCARATAAGRLCELHEYVGQDHGFFRSHQRDPALATSPYDDTLARSLAFVDGMLSPPPAAR